MRRVRLRSKGVSESSRLKDQIQALVRAIVIQRDGGCILRNYRPHHTEVLQADHLITRANSATYDDTRLIVCVCTGCHGWKHWHQKEYEDLVRTILPEKRVELWDRCERDSWRPTHRVSQDWRIAIAALKQELKSYGVDAN